MEELWGLKHTEERNTMTSARRGLCRGCRAPQNRKNPAHIAMWANETLIGCWNIIRAIRNLLNYLKPEEDRKRTEMHPSGLKCALTLRFKIEIARTSNENCPIPAPNHNISGLLDLESTSFKH